MKVDLTEYEKRKIKQKKIDIKKENRIRTKSF